jgi:glycerophosphoryl diester phosphodiesterase
LTRHFQGIDIVRLKRLTGVAAPAILTLALALAGPAPAVAGITTPLVMAHKGLHTPYGSAPENSVGAIVASSKLGVPTEIDIVFSKPTKGNPYGVPFVLHDLTLRRMTNRLGYVSTYTAAQLDHTCLVTAPYANTCSTYTIPRLITVLKRTQAAHGSLDIEIKNDDLTRGQARGIVKRLEWADAWTWDTLPGFNDPLIMSAWVHPLELVRDVATHRGDQPLATEFQTSHPDYSPANTTGSAMEAVWYKNITADAVTQLHSMGLAVDVFTSNTSDGWTAIAAAGVDWVISDNVHGYQDWVATQ